MQRSTFKLSVLASSILAVTTLGGCSFLDSESKVETQEQPVGGDIQINTDVLKVSGSILDAESGDDIEKALLEGAITFTSVGDSLSEDDIESINESLVILDDGQVAFNAPNKTFTAHIGVSIADYVERGILVENKEGSDEANFTIRLVSEETPPAGTVVVRDEDVSDKVTGGTVSESIIVKTAAVDNSSAASGETTEIVIPANVEMQDKNDEPVEGSIFITVAHHSAAETASTDAFPGGFAVVANTSSVLDGGDPEAGVLEDVALVTAGFVSVKIENEKGEEVRTFVGEPITITMQISKDTVDDENNLITDGDTIPVWSYEEDVGIWTYETDGKVSEGKEGDGLLDVTFKVTHLSYWSLAWYKRDTEICPSSRINVIADGALLTDQQISIRASLADSSGYLYSGTINGSGFATMKNLPVDQDIEFTASIGTTPIVDTTNRIIAEGTCDSDTPINLTVKEGYEEALPVKYPVTVRAKSFCDTDGSLISESVALPVYMNGWYTTMPATVNYKENEVVKALVNSTDLPTTAFIEGIKDNNGQYSSEIEVDKEGLNIIEFTIIQECETVVVTGAAAGSSGDQ